MTAPRVSIASQADPHRASDSRRIHAAATSIGLERDVYEVILSEASGGRTTTSKELTPTERVRVLEVLAKRGAKVSPRQDPRNPGADWRHAPKVKKLMAMWWAMAEAGVVNKPADNTACRRAVEAWATGHMAKGHGTQALKALRFASTEQMHQLIEALKRWGKEKGADIK